MISPYLASDKVKVISNRRVLFYEIKTDDKREIIRLRDEGMSISALAKKYHISLKNISLLIDRYKIHGKKILVKGKNRKFTPVFKSTVLNEYFDGASFKS